MIRRLTLSTALVLAAVLTALPAAAQQVRELPGGHGVAAVDAPRTEKLGLKNVTGAVHVCEHVETIACGETKNASLTDADCALDDDSFIDHWAFNGLAGQTVTITLRSTDFDTYLFLQSPDLQDQSDDDDSGGGTDSQIIETLDATGEWGIFPNSLDPNVTGAYTLTVTCVAEGSPGTPAAPSGLTASVLSSSEVELNWQDNSNNETGFIVELREGTVGDFDAIGSVGANATGAVVEGLSSNTTYQFRIRARNNVGASTVSNAVTATTAGGAGFLTTPEFPDFRFRVTILPEPDQQIPGTKVADCINDTLCVAGALANRAEVFVRIIGPRPNGFLWPTLVRFTPSAVVVEIEQLSTGITKVYTLPAIPPGVDELSGLQDRTGFVP